MQHITKTYVLWTTFQLMLLTKTLLARLLLDVEKGFALDPVGMYSDTYEESILHVFIPYNNLCIDSPTSEVCEYVKPIDPDIVEIGTIISHLRQSPVTYNKQTVSKTAQEDIRRILFNHKVDQFVQKSKSICYFFNDSFYVSHSTNEPRTTKSASAADTSRQILASVATSPATLVLEHVFNNIAGFDFLTDEQLNELFQLTVLISAETSNDRNTNEIINTITNMIIGQSTFALKSCSISQSGNTRRGPSCLVVSTVLRRLPADQSLVYQIYKFTPFPVVFQGESYVYSNVPEFVGINSVLKKVIVWNKNSFSTVCSSSLIVICRSRPVSVPLLEIPCINWLLGGDFSSNIDCLVEKTRSIQPAILNLKDQVWYVSPSGKNVECESQSRSSFVTDTKIINEPTILNFPCDQRITCSNVLLPRFSCTTTKPLIKNKRGSILNDDMALSITLNDLPDRIISLYKTGVTAAFKQLQKEVDMNEPLLKKLAKDFGNILISLLHLLLFSAVLFIMKMIKTKVTKRVNKMQTQLNVIQKEVLQDV